MTIEAAADAFWAWFQAVAGATDDELRRELDARVASLGELAWEIGSSAAGRRLAISPGGNPDLLPLTRAVVARAPRVSGWTFHPARPPKDWDLTFSLGADVRIDARGWRYLLQRYADGTLDVEIAAPDLMRYEEPIRIHAARIALDGELGEERRLARVQDVFVYYDFEAADAPRIRPFPDLKRELDAQDGGRASSASQRA